MTDDELLEMRLSQQQWYEFNTDGTLKMTATMMDKEDTTDARWKLTGTAGRTASIVIYDADPVPSLCEVEFITDDQIRLKIIPPDGSSERTIAMYQQTILMNREK